MCSASFVLCWLAPTGALALSGRQSRPSAVIPKAQEACVRVTHIDNQVGFGVLAAEPIEADQWICSYEGTLATDEECDARYPPGSRAERRACGEGDYVFRLCEGLVWMRRTPHTSRDSTMLRMAPSSPTFLRRAADRLLGVAPHLGRRGAHL